MPVVAGISGGAPDAVVVGITGVVVDGNNIAQIAAEIVTLLQDPVAANIMEERGRDRVLGKWSWEQWDDEFSKFLYART